MMAPAERNARLLQPGFQVFLGTFLGVKAGCIEVRRLPGILFPLGRGETSLGF